MVAANVNVSIIELMPNSGQSNSPVKIGYIDSAGKVTQNDTWTFPGVSLILALYVSDDSTGVWEEPTISTNVATLTNAQTGAASGIIIYR